MSRQLKMMLLLVAMLLEGSAFSFAQVTEKLSLDKTIQLALKNNSNIVNSKLDLKIAQKKIWETTAMGLPHVDVKSSYQHLFTVPVLSFPGTVLSGNKVPVNPATGTGTFSELQLSTGEIIYLNSVAGMPIELGVKDNVTADLTVSQLIFSGSYIVGLQATKVYYNLALQNDEKTKQDVVETIVNTYHMLQLAEESKIILMQNLENINKTLYEITEMYKQGFVEKTDVDQLEITATSVLNMMNQIDSNLDLGYRLLKIQLGLDASANVELTDKMETDESLLSTSMQLTAENFNIDKNVDYKLIQTSEKMAKLDLNLSKSAFLPTLSAFYNHNEQLKTSSFNFAPKDLIGINLSFPIFSSGERLAVVAQKRYSLEKAQNTKSVVSKSLMMQASQYQNDVKLKIQRYLNQKKSKELSDVIFQRTMEKYKQGMSSSMDLMNSQNQYLTSLTNYYQSIYDLQGAKSKLEKMYNINQVTDNK